MKATLVCLALQKQEVILEIASRYQGCHGGSADIDFCILEQDFRFWEIARV